MKQLVQSMKDGKVEILDCPDLKVTSKTILIDSTKSLISFGTEKMLSDFGKASYIEKAKQQPEKVKEVLSKIRTDGILATFDAVSSKLNEPMAVGYSCVGVVREVGSDIKEFNIGDRVVSNGPHSTLNRMGSNLCAKIPTNVSDDDASFTIVGSIALQSLRLFKPEIGEKIAVFGVGLIGLITVQMLIANGCEVLAIDKDSERLKLAKEYGANVCDLSKDDDPLEHAKIFSDSVGVDGVIIAASTNSNDLISTSAKICRKKARIILIGVVGLQINRSDFYEKEIKFQVSCSYGPGRYDKKYEEDGIDYPIGHVRWTAKRNFQAVLNMISNKTIKLAKLKTSSISFKDLSYKYEELLSEKNNLGIVINYEKEKKISKLELQPHAKKLNQEQKQRLKIGFIGAGNFASRTLLPQLKKDNLILDTLVNTGGIRSAISGTAHKFKNVSNDPNDIFDNDEIDVVIITSRHDTHYEFVKNAINSGKNVFVEKPLALTLDQVNDIQQCYENSNKEINLMVGFNRRFAPSVEFIKNNLDKIQSSKVINYTINAGYIPSDHWTQNEKIGGGRIIGEACHFVDLVSYLTGASIHDFNVKSLRRAYQGQKSDTVIIQLGLEDGSIANINYLSNGNKSYPKEKIEIFAGEKVLILDNFSSVKGYGANVGNKKYFKQDKGHKKCIHKFLESVINCKDSPISHEEIFDVSKKVIDIASRVPK